MSIKVLPIPKWVKIDPSELKNPEWRPWAPRFRRDLWYTDGCIVFMEFQNKEGEWVCYWSCNEASIKSFEYTLAILNMKERNSQEMEAIRRCVELKIAPKEWVELLNLYDTFGDKATLKSRLSAYKLNKRIKAIKDTRKRLKGEEI